MRYGICTGIENLELLEQAGYDYIELNATSVMEMDQAQQESCREKLKNSRVKCEAFNVLFPQTMELVDGNTSEEQLRAYVRKVMELIHSFGAEVAVFGSGKCRRCPEHLSYVEGFKKLIQVYRITGEIAAEYGIQLAIEPLSRTETNMICTMAEGAMLEASVDLPNVGLLADFYHVMGNHDHIQDIETIRHFRHIHIAAEHGRKYPLSQEGEEYAAFLKALKKVGYDGRISIEGKTDDMEHDAYAALKFLKDLENQVKDTM